MRKINQIKQKTETKSLSFYWVFNPDGSIIDYSSENYQSMLEKNYRSDTSSEAYLGGY